MTGKRGARKSQSLDDLRAYRAYTSGKEDLGAYCPTADEIAAECAKLRKKWKDSPRRSRALDPVAGTRPFVPRFAIKLDSRHNGIYLVGRR